MNKERKTNGVRRPFRADTKPGSRLPARLSHFRMSTGGDEERKEKERSRRRDLANFVEARTEVQGRDTLPTLGSPPHPNNNGHVTRLVLDSRRQDT